MLIEFRVKNFRSFKDEQVLSMVASSDDSLPQNTTQPEGLGNIRLLNSAVIYGPNASGKSNLIKALKFAFHYIMYSDALTSMLVEVQPFALSKETINNPTQFSLDFISKGVRYKYSFSVIRNRVLEELLYAYPKGLPQKWFERRAKSDSTGSEWEFGSYLKGEKSRLANLTRDEVLFLTVASKFNNKQLLEVFNWFGHLPFRGVEGKTITALLTSLVNNTKSRLIQTLKKADLGIADFQVFDRKSGQVISNDMNVDDFKAWYKIFQGNMGIKIKHQGEIESFFSLEDESKGTLALFEIGSDILMSLELEKVLLIDDLTESFHTLLTKAIVKLFHNQPQATSSGQLIFNTHDTTLLDLDVFRRDQIWFVEKDNKGASHLYSLSEYSPRKNESIQKGYLAGRYGAIPILDDFMAGAVEQA